MNTRVTLAALAALALGCTSNDPYCSEFDDGTGFAVAFCHNGRQDPVCDLPGEEARFEMTSGSYMLVGGVRARCDSSREVVCPAGAEGVPYCITDPEL